MTLPCTAVMKEEKFIMIDKKKVVIAEKGKAVTIYNADHGDIYLCTNEKNETFSIHKDLLTIKV